MKVRWMVRKDLADILEAAPYLTEHGLLSLLRKHETICLVGEYGDKVICFTVYEPLKTRIKVRYLVVNEKWQTMGFGSLLLARLVGKLSDRRPVLFVDVDERALGVQLWLKHRGFVATGVNREAETYRMEYRIAVEAVR